MAGEGRRKIMDAYTVQVCVAPKLIEWIKEMAEANRFLNVP